ncbi:hypothetical protein DY000_02014317 [Brassica cretica]|uniref:Uncharacterized protein n=1 Tax=Brassica cretica TaxID=69181 RepID=A0ABQ7D6C1_BRACR|nr:hypothetical protein DY000_02014317 [Brassica cretica]
MMAETVSLQYCDPLTIVIVSFVVWSSSAFIPGLVSLSGVLRRRIPVRLQRAIGLEDEIFHAGYFGEFPSLSAFAASDLGLFFGQLLLFDPVDIFLLFRHWLIERGLFPSRSASGSSWISLSVLLGIVGDVAGIQVDVLRRVGLSEFLFSAGDVSLGFWPEGHSRDVQGLSSGVAKASLFPQTFVVPQGRISRVCSSDLFS